MKKALKSESLRRVFCWLAAHYIRLVYHTGRWTVVGGEIPRRFWDKGEPFILAFWHGRLLMMPYCWERSKTIYMLISQHRDGQLIAGTVGHFGIRSAAGSTTRGGAQALRTMVKALKAGDCVGITPDGPRGPRMRATDGIVNVARMSGAAVIPAAFGTSSGRTLSTWDRFLLAWPLGRGVIVWGEPIRVERDAGPDAIARARADVEGALNAVTREADGLSGRPPVEPAPEPKTETGTADEGSAA